MNGRLQKSLSADDARNWRQNQEKVGKVVVTKVRKKAQETISDDIRSIPIHETDRHYRRDREAKVKDLSTDGTPKNPREPADLSTKEIRHGCRQWLKELLIKYLSNDETKEGMFMKAIPSTADVIPQSDEKLNLQNSPKYDNQGFSLHKTVSLENYAQDPEHNQEKVNIKKRHPNKMHVSPKRATKSQVSPLNLNFSRGDWKESKRKTKTKERKEIDVERMTKILESFLRKEFSEDKASKWKKYLMEKELKTIQNIATSQRETQAYPLWDSTAALAQTTKEYLTSALARLSPGISEAPKAEGEAEKKERDDDEGGEESRSISEGNKEKRSISRFTLRKKHSRPLKEEPDEDREPQNQRSPNFHSQADKENLYETRFRREDAIVVHKVKPIKETKEKKSSRLRVIVEDKEYKISRDLFTEHSEAFQRAVNLRSNALPVAIALDNITREQFKTIRNWMNGEETVVNESNAEDILQVAEMLEMGELCRKCKWLLRKEAGGTKDKMDDEKIEEEGKEKTDNESPGEEVSQEKPTESEGEPKTENSKQSRKQEKLEKRRRKLEEKRRKRELKEKEKQARREKKKAKEEERKRERRKSRKQAEEKEKRTGKRKRKGSEVDEKRERKKKTEQDEEDKDKEEKEVTEEVKIEEREMRDIETNTEEEEEKELEKEEKKEVKKMEDKSTMDEREDIDEYCRRKYRPTKASVVYWNIDPGCEVHYEMLDAKERDYKKQRAQEEEEEQERRRHHVPRKTFLVEKRKEKKGSWCTTPRHRRFREQPKPVAKKRAPVGSVACSGDLVLIVDKHRVYVNRFMAQKHSRCLARLLAEKGPVKMSSVVIEGISEWVIRDIADWLNGGSLCLTPKNVSAFVDATKKLEMPLLLHKCRHYMLQVDEGYCEAVMIPPDECCQDGLSFVEVCGKAVKNMAKSVWNRAICEEEKPRHNRLWDSECSSESTTSETSVSSTTSWSSSTTTDSSCKSTEISDSSTPKKKKKKKKSILWKDDEFCASVVRASSDEKKQRMRHKRQTFHSDDDKCIAVYIKPVDCISSTESSVSKKTARKVSKFLCGMAQCKESDSRLSSIMKSLTMNSIMTFGESFCGGNYGIQHSHRQISPNKVKTKNMKFPFDPNRYHWVIAAPSAMCHAFSAAVVFKGKLYVSGGRAVQSHASRPGPEAVTCIWRFDHEIMKWNHVAYMTTPRIHHMMAVFDNAIYIIGGIDDQLRMMSSVDCFHPECGLVSVRAPLGVARAGVTAAAYQSCLWVMGGLLDPCTNSAGFHTVNIVERYDAGQNRWCGYYSLNVPRAFATAIVFEDALYIIGGVTLVDRVAAHTEAMDVVPTVEVLEGTTRTWICFSDIEKPRYCASAVVHECCIYLFGGVDLNTGNVVMESEHLCPDTHMWTSADTQFSKRLQENLYAI